VGDDDGGPAGAQALEGVGDPGLAGRVQVAGGLVQDQQGGVGDPGPGEGDQLALPGRQQRAPLADLGVVAVGQAGDDLVGPDRPGGGRDLGPGRVRPAEADVVQDRAREQEPVLWALVLFRVRNARLAPKSAQILLISLLPMPLPAPSTQHPAQPTVRRSEAELIVGMPHIHGVSAAVSADDAGGQYPQMQLEGRAGDRRPRSADPGRVIVVALPCGVRAPGCRLG
jgi:hypothetical protein